jgi:hypothetical protein
LIVDERRGDWIQTYRGKQFWPLDPRPEDVDLDDIVHALCHKCRYQGHTVRFYSVGEHSCLLADHFGSQLILAPEVRLRRARLALFHDAGETYLPDVPRPIKPYLPFFQEVEDRIQTMILERYGIEVDETDWTALHEADWRICLDEMAVLLSKSPASRGKLEELAPLGVTIEALLPVDAELRFRETLQRYGMSV